MKMDNPAGLTNGVPRNDLVELKCLKRNAVRGFKVILRIAAFSGKAKEGI
jgi:hypothetical protein